MIICNLLLNLHMNIFWLDSDLKLSCQYHCDKHCVKMILEYSQLLCTAVNLYGFEAPYKTTHINHPCSKWVRYSFANFDILHRKLQYLLEEYTFRYKKAHKCHLIDDWIQLNKNHIKSKLPDLELSVPPLAMPDDAKLVSNEYNFDDVVKSYRNYYKLYKPFANINKREIPYFL